MPGGPDEITLGPDGAFWFTESSANAIGRITTDGKFSQFIVPTASAEPFGITVGPDGALWFTETAVGANKIGRLTTQGVFKEYALTLYDTVGTGIASGPDGSIWFTEENRNKIGSINLAGNRKTLYALPPNSSPTAIITGPDGDLWVTFQGTNSVGRFSTEGHLDSNVPLISGSVPNGGLTIGPDGNVWVIDGGTYPKDYIVRVTPQGQISQCRFNNDLSPVLSGITTANGDLWFTEQGTEKIGRMTVNCKVTDFALPKGVSPYSIVDGPDGAVWFTVLNSGIGRITTGVVVRPNPQPTATL